MKQNKGRVFVNHACRQDSQAACEYFVLVTRDHSSATSSDRQTWGLLLNTEPSILIQSIKFHTELSPLTQSCRLGGK